MAGALLPIVGAVTLMQVASDESWITPERITILQAAGARTVVGYVLNTSGDWTTVLTESTRTVVRYPSAEVTRRVVCKLNDKSSRIRTLISFSWHGGSAKYQSCR